MALPAVQDRIDYLRNCRCGIQALLRIRPAGMGAMAWEAEQHSIHAAIARHGTASLARHGTASLARLLRMPWVPLTR
eukprot:1072159-Pyramimonas_sp.AAC.1